MDGRPAWCVIRLGVALSPAATVSADDASALRLIPFPKRVSLQTGTFRLDRPLVARIGPKAGPQVSQVGLGELHRTGVVATGLPVPDLDDCTRNCGAAECRRWSRSVRPGATRAIRCISVRTGRRCTEQDRRCSIAQAASRATATAADPNTTQGPGVGITPPSEVQGAVVSWRDSLDGLSLSLEIGQQVGELLTRDALLQALWHQGLIACRDLLDLGA